MTEDYEARQDQWIEDNDIKIGDTVRVLGEYKDYTDGWSNSWTQEMTDCIGKEYTIGSTQLGANGIKLMTLDQNYWFCFPYFVLEPVKQKQEKDELREYLDGLTSFEIDNIKAFLNAKEKPWNVDEKEPTDNVNHPPHYKQHPSGVECIQITEHFGFCIGNAIKYLWRAKLKGKEEEDLRKAIWLIEREIKNLTGEEVK